jgi:hypothetical protein
VIAQFTIDGGPVQEYIKREDRNYHTPNRDMESQVRAMAAQIAPQGRVSYKLISYPSGRNPWGLRVARYFFGLEWISDVHNRGRKAAAGRPDAATLGISPKGVKRDQIGVEARVLNRTRRGRNGKLDCKSAWPDRSESRRLSSEEAAQGQKGQKSGKGGGDGEAGSKAQGGQGPRRVIRTFVYEVPQKEEPLVQQMASLYLP